VSVVAWRIVQRRLVKSAFTGEGARRFGGRWNSPGRAVVYTGGSQALAALEMLVHLDSEKLLQSYVAMPVNIPERLIHRVRLSDLPRNWRAYPTPGTTRAIGDEWLARSDSPVLQVPSTVIPSEANFLLNPAHKLFHKLGIGKPCPFRFDARLIGPF
jgi:RES domain-containing protein